MKTPFKLKYDSSPLRNKLNSPLKQPFFIISTGLENVTMGEDWTQEGYHSVSNKPSYFNVPCTLGENCPTKGGVYDEDPDVAGHQLETRSLQKSVAEDHEAMGEHLKKLEKQNLVPVRGTSELNLEGYDLSDRIAFHHTGDRLYYDKMNVQKFKGEPVQESYEDHYKRTGTWQGEGSLPSHLEGTYTKPKKESRFKRWWKLNFGKNEEKKFT